MEALTPFQTIGPYFAVAMPGAVLPFRDDEPGERIRIRGQVRDGAGAPAPDVMLETWQADAAGRLRPDAGWGRFPTDAEGRFEITTVRPGRVPGPEGALQAPHLLLSLLARGILTRLVTRLYFADEPSTSEDPILRLAPAERRHTLVARPTDDGAFAFDLVLQGLDETVFFDV